MSKMSNRCAASGAVLAGPEPERGRGTDTRTLVRVAQLYYGMHLTQEAIGERLGISRFKVGRLLDRAVRDEIVRIEIVHPAARLVDLEELLAVRFGLRSVVVADVPAGADRAAEELIRTAVARAGVAYLGSVRPTGIVGVSWGRTMLEVARLLEPGWTAATEIVQLNGAISRSARPTRATEIAERFGATAGASIRLMAAPAIVGSPELRVALEADPSVGETLDAARRASSAVFSLGVLSPESVLVESGYLSEHDLARLAATGAVGDVLGRFLAPDGSLALPELDERTVGLPLEALREKDLAIGLAAGPGRGPIALAALRAGILHALVTDEGTADWLVAHG